jgi:hypothetical protein
MSQRFWSDDDMSESELEFDDAELDSLVDGSLAEPRRRSLLLALEAAPDGWRRCALAFLEAQAWRAALGELEGAAPSPVADVPAPTIVSPARRQYVSLMKQALRAAVVLLAFGTGWMLGHLPARQATPLVAGAGNPPTAVSPRPSTVSADLLAAPRREAVPPASIASSELAPRPQSAKAASALPPPLRDHLLREGYRIRESTALTAIALDDGTRIAVPVAQVRLQFVGGTTY